MKRKKYSTPSKGKKEISPMGSDNITRFHVVLFVKGIKNVTEMCCMHFKWD